MSNLAISPFANRLRIFVIALMVGMGTLMALGLWGLTAGPVHVELREHASGIDPRVTAAMSILLLEIALFELTRMLRLIAAGDRYSMRVVHHFRAFASWLLFLAFLRLIGPLVAIAIEGAPAGSNRIIFPLSLNDLITFSIALLLFLLALLMERAREIEQENSEIV